MKKILALCVISLFSFTFSGCFSKYYAERYEGNETIIVNQPVEIIIDHPILETPSYYIPVGETHPTQSLGKSNATKTKNRTNNTDNTRTKLRDLNSGSQQSNSNTNTGHIRSGRTGTQTGSTGNSKPTMNNNAKNNSRNTGSRDNTPNKPAIRSSGRSRR